MDFLRFLLGNGTLDAELEQQLESEGLVLAEEGIKGSVRYTRFRAPGRYHHGKITPERFGLGLSRKRLVVYVRSGRVKLVDTEFDNPRLDALTLSPQDGRLDLTIDYDRLGQEGISGEVTLRLKTANAARIAEQLRARIPQAA